MKSVGLVDIVHSSAFNKTVTLDEYQTLYFDYLKIGGKPLLGVLGCPLVRPTYTTQKNV